MKSFQEQKTGYILHSYDLKSPLLVWPVPPPSDTSLSSALNLDQVSGHVISTTDQQTPWVQPCCGNWHYRSTFICGSSSSSSSIQYTAEPWHQTKHTTTYDYFNNFCLVLLMDEIKWKTPVFHWLSRSSFTPLLFTFEKHAFHSH